MSLYLLTQKHSFFIEKWIFFQSHLMKVNNFSPDFFALPLQPRVVSLLGIGKNLCPVSRHMPFSSDPFLYGISLSKATFSASLIKRETHFSFQFFDDQYREAIHALGKSSGTDIDKISVSSINFEIADGQIYTPESLWGMILKKHKVLDMGDHLILIGTPEKYWHQPVDKLKSAEHILFYGRGFYAKSTDLKRVPRDIKF